jgi:hypothetical protein
MTSIEFGTRPANHERMITAPSNNKVKPPDPRRDHLMKDDHHYPEYHEPNKRRLKEEA